MMPASREESGMARKPTREVNRNGLLGEYEAFKPRKRSMEELFALARLGKGEPRPAPAIESRELARDGGFKLVRYRTGSDELTAALDTTGGERFYPDPEHWQFISYLGVVGPDGKARVVMSVTDDPNDPGHEISFLFAGKDHGVPSEAMLHFLRELDVPASWRAGADAGFRDKFDLAWDADADAWAHVEPVTLVKVSYKRMCFATRPALEETVDVMLLPVEGQDIDDADADKAYWAKDYYRDAGWEELHRADGGRPPRPGFSSWLHEGDPVKVKVVGNYLDSEIERLREQAARPPEPDEEDEPEEEAGPRP
jgi:hypothetical protein